jgi:CRISPR-associated protein (TIGR03986 family)
MNDSKNSQKKTPQTRYDQIPSPYNFVPLSDFVYFPEWAESVSHDVPFSEGISGELEVEVTAKTPIYVRNGDNWKDENSKQELSYREFFRLTQNGDYMIPGSTFKGMLRSIIEIASFGKMQRIDDDRYSIRDLNFKPYQNAMAHKKTRTGAGIEPASLNFKPYQNAMAHVSQRSIVSKVKSGWLIEKEDKWFLTPCLYAKVGQSDLEKYSGDEIEIGRIKESAVAKYKKWEGKKQLSIKASLDRVEKDYPHGKGHFRYRKATNLGKGTQEGTIVFTGQPNPRVDKNGNPKPKTKRIDFVFFEDSPKSIPIPNQLREDFEFIHSDDKENPLEEWEFWKTKMQQGQRIPVFYLEDDKGELASMGLAMMYRLAYKLTIGDAIKNTSYDHFLSKPDLAELIFGYVNDNNEALRGRVHIGHLVAQNKPSLLPLVTTILGNPKPTYYPNYICQDEEKGILKEGEEYKTLLDEGSQIRGWKRYPVRKDGFKPFAPPPPMVKGKTNEDVATHFKPLPSESTFKGKIRFHNLRPEELGAVVWALTWGGNEKLRHSIGMAKPYGFGSVQIKITSKEEEIKLDSVCKAFTDLMQRRLQEERKLDWQSSAQIKLLLAMADPEAKPEMKLEYPRLEMEGVNDFADYKKAKKVLLPYIAEILATSAQTNQSKPVKPRQYKKGDKVKCVVLEEKTKNGGWKFQIEDLGEKGNGNLPPSEISKTPSDIAPGKIYEMILFSDTPKNCQFKWCENKF